MRALLAVSLLALVLAGCAGGGGGKGTGGGSSSDTSSSSGGAVVLAKPADSAVGTTWDYDFSGASTGSQHTVLEAREAKGGFEAARLKTTGSSQGATVELTAWNRRSDGANIQADSKAEAPYVGTVTSTTTWNPPCQVLHYPVRAGDVYESSCTSTTSTTVAGSPQTATTTTVTKVEVLESGKTTVPAGTFDTVHVRSTVQGNVADSYYLLDGCGAARTTSTVNGSSSTTELKATTCS